MVTTQTITPICLSESQSPATNNETAKSTASEEVISLTDTDDENFSPKKPKRTTRRIWSEEDIFNTGTVNHIMEDRKVFHVFFTLQSDESFPLISSIETSPIRSKQIEKLQSKTGGVTSSMEDLFAKYATPDKKKVSTTNSSPIQLTPKEKMDLSLSLNADDKYITACRALEQMTSGLKSKATDACGSFKLNGSTTIDNGAKMVNAKFTKIVHSKNMSYNLPLTTVDHEIENTREPSPVKAEIIAPKLSKFSLYDEWSFNSLSKEATSSTVLPKTSCPFGESIEKKVGIGTLNDQPQTRTKFSIKSKTIPIDYGNSSTIETSPSVLSIRQKSTANIEPKQSGGIAVVKKSLKSGKPLAEEASSLFISKPRSQELKCLPSPAAVITSDSDDDFMSDERSGRALTSNQLKSFTSPMVVSKSPKTISKLRLKSSRPAKDISKVATKTDKSILNDFFDNDMISGIRSVTEDENDFSGCSIESDLASTPVMHHKNDKDSYKTSKFVLKKYQRSAGADVPVTSTILNDVIKPPLTKPSPSSAIDEETVMFEPKTANKPLPVIFKNDSVIDFDDDTDFYDQITNQTCTLAISEPIENSPPTKPANRIPNRRTSIGNAFIGLDSFVSKLNESSAGPISVCISKYIINSHIIKVCPISGEQSRSTEERRASEIVIPPSSGKV